VQWSKYNYKFVVEFKLLTVSTNVIYTFPSYIKDSFAEIFWKWIK